MTTLDVRKPTRRQRRAQHHDTRYDDAATGRDRLAAAYASLRAALADTDHEHGDHAATLAAAELRRHADRLRRGRR